MRATEIINYLATGIRYFACPIQTDIATDFAPAAVIHSPIIVPTLLNENTNSDFSLHISCRRIFVRKKKDIAI